MPPAIGSPTVRLCAWAVTSARANGRRRWSIENGAPKRTCKSCATGPERSPLRRAFRSSVRFSIWTRSSRSTTNGHERTRVQLQGVTQIVEANAMSQLPVEQTDHMTPRVERARLGFRSREASDFGLFMQRNVIANLAQDVESGSGWSNFELIHPCRVEGANKKFQPILSNPVGRL
jgi:hypothetical protein